jgi:molybdopterin-guanine dinucleotide biosynthesis protein
MEKILEKVKEKKVIALIGNSKNSGKTTTLNYMLDNFQNAGVLTIGLDGEEKDLLYGNFKPKIHLRKGQCVCASKDQLKYGFEILDQVDKDNLYIARALTDLDLSIVNPGGRTEIEKVISKLSEYVDIVFIDGAFDRIFSVSIVDGVIFCVGTSDKNLLRFKNIYSLLNLPVKKLKIPYNSIYRDSKYIPVDCDLMVIDCLRRSLTKYEAGDFLLLKGALTREMSSILKKVEVVVSDPSRVMLNYSELKKFFSNNNHLFVSKRPEILFLSLNTFNPDNFDKDPISFYHEVRKITDKHLVLNLMSGGEKCFSVL